MDEISQRKGPELKFILPEHSAHFETRVLTRYFECKDIFPHILNHIFYYLIDDKPEQFIAAYLGKKHLNPHYFYDVTASMTQREKIQYIQNMKEEHVKIFNDECLYEDIRSVLMFYCMSFLDIYGTTDFEAKQGLYYRNMPFEEVW